MAQSKEVVPAWEIEFVQELTPASKQIPLLYHLSYLCLAKFPKLERLLRARAVETQILFGESEGILFQCMGTSKNLVKSLFPMLIVAVEKNKATLAVKYLNKAGTWIKEIIDEVQKMLDSYKKHTKDVGTTTSDVITEKDETEKKLQQLSQEIEEMNKGKTKLDQQLNEVAKKLEENEKQTEAKKTELLNHVRDVTQKSSGMSILGVVPFIGSLIKSVYDTATSPDAVTKTKALELELNQLFCDKTSLRTKEWTLELKLIDWQMNLSKLMIDQGVIPEPVHLGEVQQHLSKIQNILMQLIRFWEWVDKALKTMRDQTFTNEDLLEENDSDLKQMFIDSIKSASQVWTDFAAGCSVCVDLFKVQNLKAYAFLEQNPSSLTEEEWQRQYDAVRAELENANKPAELKACITIQEVENVNKPAELPATKP
ncbi:uncharacterized protein LOC134318391 [Trichomycterus rosablanca]|uniref:uncharacterized protein LOC134318391 n=1 Tax=Trichomycterus rosablanca TaxID=2290929 RepID=UPI002F35350B